MRIRFFMAEAIRSIRANVAISVAATVTVLIAVLLLGAFIPTFLAVQSTIDDQKAKLDISVYIKDEATVQQVNGLQTSIAGLQSEGLVRDFSYVSKDDALAILREQLRDESVLDELASNPLPASFEVLPVDPANNANIVSQLEGHPAVHEELGVEFEAETTNRFLDVVTIVRWVMLGLTLLLLVAAILLIGNTIRLSIFARRREVEVMKLVGATNWFIRWPYVIEGILCGLAGAVVAVILLLALKVGVVDPLSDATDSSLSDDGASSIGFASLALILILSGAVVGAVGSGITLRRFLRV